MISLGRLGLLGHFFFRFFRLSAATNFFPTDLGMPSVDLPAAAARIARACFLVLLGIRVSLS